MVKHRFTHLRFYRARLPGYPRNAFFDIVRFVAFVENKLVLPWDKRQWSIRPCE